MREAALYVAIGKKGVGKTYTTTQLIYDYVTGFNHTVKPRRVLILDVNDEFTQFKSINLNDIHRFNSHPIIECRRIRPFNPDGSKMSLNQIAETLSKILATFKGGLLLVEDINRYISDNMNNDVIGALCTNRHVDMDIIIHYQAIGRITPKVWQNMTVLRFHKNTESTRRHEKKFEDKAEIFAIAENIVNNEYDSGNIRFNLYVDIDKFKIRGNIQPEAITQAVDQYIYEEYPRLSRRLKNQAKVEGKKITDPEILQRLRDKLKATYF